MAKLKGVLQGKREHDGLTYEVGIIGRVTLVILSELKIRIARLITQCDGEVK